MDLGSFLMDLGSFLMDLEREKKNIKKKYY